MTCEIAMRLRPGLRVWWVRAGAALGEGADGYEDKSKREALTAAWWEANRARLPLCQEPRPSVPVLVDGEGTIVALLAADALTSTQPTGLRLVKDPST